MKRLTLLLMALTTSFLSHAEHKIALNLLSQKNKYGVELVSLINKEMKSLNIFTENKQKAGLIVNFSVLENENIGSNQQGVIVSALWVHKSSDKPLPYAFNFNVFRCPKDVLNNCVDRILYRSLKASKQLDLLLASKHL